MYQEKPIHNKAPEFCKRLINHVQKFKGFVFKKVQWANPEKTEIDVLVEARANSQPRCSQC